MDSKDSSMSMDKRKPVNIISLSSSKLLAKIFEFLPQEDLFAVRLVCKAFNEAASDPEVLKLDLLERWHTIGDLEAVIVQPFLKNITRLNLSYLNDNNKTTKLFKKLEDHCSNLYDMFLFHSTIPGDVSLRKIGKRLRRLHLTNLQFENASHFFETTPDDPVYENLRDLSLYGCSFTEDHPPFEGISRAPMSNLRTLKLQDLKGFDDREYEHLKATLSNVTELNLYDMKVDGESFKRLDLSKMTRLDMYRCETGNDFLSSLSRCNACELREFYGSDLDLGDNFSEEDTFTRLGKLEQIQMHLCAFDNRIVSAIGSQLLNLKYWEMVPKVLNLVTDEALTGLVIQHDLEHIQLENVRLTGSSLEKIARCAPALKHLILNRCSARDEHMNVFEENFTRLVKLSITGLQITDSGLVKLQSRLSLLENLTLESQFVTRNGLLWLIPFLKATKCVNIRFGNDQNHNSWFYYNCFCEEECQISFSGSKTSEEETMIALTKHFRNATQLCFFDLTLSATAMQFITKTQPDVNTITFRNCVFDANVATLVFKNFLHLRNFYVYDGHMTDNAVSKLIEGIDGKSVLYVDIENDTMPNDETIRRRILPNLASVSVFNLRTYEHEQQMYVSKNESEILFVGMEQISDETVVTAMKLCKEMSYLALVDTAVTSEGISEIAPMLDRVDFLRLRSKILGDETMATIGNNFPSLKTLYMECDRVTDDGFEALGKHLESLESLCIIRSQITDYGIKKIVPLLKSVTTLDLYRENVNVTKDLVKFMKETYPDVTHYVCSEQLGHEMDIAEERQDFEGDDDRDPKEPNLEAEHDNGAEEAP